MSEWGLCTYVIVHIILPHSPVIWWIELGGKSKWLPLNFGYHDVMRTAPSTREKEERERERGGGGGEGVRLPAPDQYTCFTGLHVRK